MYARPFSVICVQIRRLKAGPAVIPSIGELREHSPGPRLSSLRMADIQMRPT